MHTYSKSFLAFALLHNLFFFTNLLYADSAAAKISVSLGQRYEPIVEIFNSEKLRYQSQNPKNYYPGFVGELSNSRINNGVPLGATFGTPLSISLKHAQYSVTFPTSKLSSFTFSESGELKYFSFNPQQGFTNSTESSSLIDELHRRLSVAGWKRNGESDAIDKWYAAWVSADIFVKRTHCEGDKDEGIACELVQVSVAPIPKVTAKILQCGEIEKIPPKNQRKESGSHTGVISIMGENETPRFKPGCPQITARLGTQFGVQLLVNSQTDTNILDDLVTRVTHPRFLDGSTTDEWANPMNVRLPRYTGWIFEEQQELVPGIWKLELVLGTETLAQQTFQVKIN